MKKICFLLPAALVVFSAASGFCSEAPEVVLETVSGNITLRLMPETAPRAVENFTGLVRKGYYDGVIFHRVIKGFMIQGGDPTGTGRGGDSLWGGSFEDEVSPEVPFNRPGLLAMANAGPNTNRSQFFITTAPAPWLNMRHTIFGEVVSGMETVKKIENSSTGPGDRPLREQRIRRAYVRERQAEESADAEGNSGGIQD